MADQATEARSARRSAASRLSFCCSPASDALAAARRSAKLGRRACGSTDTVTFCLTAISFSSSWVPLAHTCAIGSTPRKSPPSWSCESPHESGVSLSKKPRQKPRGSVPTTNVPRMVAHAAEASGGRITSASRSDGTVSCSDGWSAWSATSAPNDTPTSDRTAGHPVSARVQR